MVQISLHLSEKQLAFIDKAAYNYQGSRNSFITRSCVEAAEKVLGTKIGDYDASEPKQI